MKTRISIGIAVLLCAYHTLSAQAPQMRVIQSGISTTYRVDQVDSIIFTDFVDIPTVTDYDGNIYRVVTIGDQTWMAESLRVTHFNDGTPITLVEGDTEWQNTGFGNDPNPLEAYCFLFNRPDTYATVFGAIYNGWVVVSNKNVCPQGWHVASDADWDELIAEVGDPFPAAKLATNSLLWADGLSTPGNNIDQRPGFDSSGFDALPGASRNFNGFFPISYGFSVRFWSSTPNNDSPSLVTLKTRSISNGGNLVSEDDTQPPNLGSYIRCIQD